MINDEPVIFIALMWVIAFVIFGLMLWRKAVKWFWQCPIFHSEECLNGAWQDEGCSCGRLGRDEKEHGGRGV